MQLLADMEIRTSHIFREGNVPPNSLSNTALNVDSFCWWDYGIPEIRGAVYDDRIGKAKYRFCCVFFWFFCCIFLSSFSIIGFALAFIQKTASK